MNNDSSSLNQYAGQFGVNQDEQTREDRRAMLRNQLVNALKKVGSVLNVALTREPNTLFNGDPGSFYGNYKAGNYGKAGYNEQGNPTFTPASKIPFSYVGDVQAVPGIAQAIAQQVAAAEATKNPQAVQAIFDNAHRILQSGGGSEELLGRPWHQPVLEAAAQSGNKELIAKVLKLIPKTDPYFRSMMSMFGK